MNSCLSGRSRLLVLVLVLLTPLSCGRDPLPQVPAFDDLGFSNALDVVQQQMLDAYQRWQVEPRDAERNGRLGMLLSTYGKNAASEVLYRRARILAPGEFRWTYYLAVALSQMSRSEEAVGMYREALAIDPGHQESRIQLAGLLFQMNSIAESVELYRGITAESPERVEGWLGLGKALHRMGDLEGAVTSLKRARLAGPQYGEVRYALATALRASGDDEEAARELAAHGRTAGNRIHTTDPLMLEVIRLNAGDMRTMAKADYQLARGQYGQAVALFREALAINPVNQNAWGGLVFSLAELGKTEQTGAAYREALEAGVSYRRLHLTYGKALMKWQQPDAARQVIGRAIEMDPQYADAWTLMGELEMRSGSSAVAVEQFRRSLSAVPNDRAVVLLLAQALNATGQFKEAVTWLEPLTSDSTVDRSLALKELAIAYHGLDRKDEAIDALQRGRTMASVSVGAEIDALLAEWQADRAE